MKLLKMEPGEHRCIIFSLAMLLDETPQAIIEEIGHDGTEKWWPYPPPHGDRGHHIQEIIDVCLAHGIVLTPIERFPLSGCGRDASVSRNIWDDASAERRFKELLTMRRGLLITPTHAYAWDGSIAWDPNGRKCFLEDTNAIECWLMTGITS